MDELRELIIDEAVPYFDQFGTIAGFAADADKRARRNPQDFHHQEALFTIRLIQGDIDAALRAAKAVELAVQDYLHEPATQELRTRVAHTAKTATQDPAEALRILRHNAEETRVNLEQAHKA
jgi:hypothetical protein